MLGGSPSRIKFVLRTSGRVNSRSFSRPDMILSEDNIFLLDQTRLNYILIKDNVLTDDVTDACSSGIWLSASFPYGCSSVAEECILVFLLPGPSLLSRSSFSPPIQSISEANNVLFAPVVSLSTGSSLADFQQSSQCN